MTEPFNESGDEEAFWLNYVPEDTFPASSRPLRQVTLETPYENLQRIGEKFPEKSPEPSKTVKKLTPFLGIIIIIVLVFLFVTLANWIAGLAGYQIVWF